MNTYRYKKSEHACPPFLPSLSSVKEIISFRDYLLDPVLRELVSSSWRPDWRPDDEDALRSVSTLLP